MDLINCHWESLDMPMNSGLSVCHDCLESLDLSTTEAAHELGVGRKQFSDVVDGRSGISPEMAIRLDKASETVQKSGTG